MSVYGGVYSSEGLGGLILDTPPWDARWGGSTLLAVTAAGRLARIGNSLDIEAEIGAGQRFGDLTASEFWAALFFRWTNFPWNKFVRTSVAVSSGLNYATHIDAAEAGHPDSGSRGSKLLHFLAPEITFAHPKRPRQELFLRFHHRSGGADYWGDVGAFNGTGHGSDYAAAGIRVRF